MTSPIAAEAAPQDDDEHWTTSRAAEFLEWYAAFIRSNVMSVDIEMHPYLPELEYVAGQMRTRASSVSAASSAAPAPAEPVAWMCNPKMNRTKDEPSFMSAARKAKADPIYAALYDTPLYASPVAAPGRADRPPLSDAARG